MLKSIFAYTQFLLKSTNKHGVHSPFVYDLITKCFNDNTKYIDYNALQQYRRLLLTNTTKVVAPNLDAKSQDIKSNLRRISQITRNIITYKRTKLLYRLVNYFQFNSILELGTSSGIVAQASLLANPKVKITTIQNYAHSYNITLKHLPKQLHNIKWIRGNFTAELQTLKKDDYDFIFFDANHIKTTILSCFETLLEAVHNDSVFVFNGIYNSKEMMQAWQTVKQHPKVKVTIDTFFWGFVFFRKEQHKEHFVVRV